MKRVKRDQNKGRLKKAKRKAAILNETKLIVVRKSKETCKTDGWMNQQFRV